MLKPKTVASKTWIAKIGIAFIFCFVLVVIGVHSVWETFHWENGMMRDAVYGSWPEVWQKTIHFSFGTMFLISGVGIAWKTFQLIANHRKE
jgi:hypothetical protein